MESWMPFFVIVTAVAVVLQAIVLMVLFVQLRRTAARVEQTISDLNTRVTPIINRVQLLVEDVSPHISSITSNVSELTELARGQALKVDRMLNEAMEMLRLQLIHIDQMVTATMEAVEETGSRLKQSIWRPVVRATALIRGIQTGFEHFRTARQGREPIEPPAERQDKGMFI